MKHENDCGFHHRDISDIELDLKQRTFNEHHKFSRIPPPITTYRYLKDLPKFHIQQESIRTRETGKFLTN